MQINGSNGKKCRKKARWALSNTRHLRLAAHQSRPCIDAVCLGTFRESLFHLLDWILLVLKLHFVSLIKMNIILRALSTPLHSPCGTIAAQWRPATPSVAAEIMATSRLRFDDYKTTPGKKEIFIKSRKNWLQKKKKKTSKRQSHGFMACCWRWWHASSSSGSVRWWRRRRRRWGKIKRNTEGPERCYNVWWIYVLCCCCHCQCRHWYTQARPVWTKKGFPSNLHGNLCVWKSGKYVCAAATLLSWLYERK